MQDRRTFLQIVAAALPAVALGAQAPASAPKPPRELARHTLTGPLESFDVVLIELNPGPGTGRDHRHTGPVLGYVVDGQVRFGVNHGAEEIIPAGGTFFEPTGAVHSAFGSASPNATARVLAFMVVPKGSSGAAPA